MLHTVKIWASAHLVGTHRALGDPIGWRPQGAALLEVCHSYRLWLGIVGVNPLSAARGMSLNNSRDTVSDRHVGVASQNPFKGRVDVLMTVCLIYSNPEIFITARQFIYCQQINPSIPQLNFSTHSLFSSPPPIFTQLPHFRMISSLSLY